MKAPYPHHHHHHHQGSHTEIERETHHNPTKATAAKGMAAAIHKAALWAAPPFYDNQTTTVFNAHQQPQPHFFHLTEPYASTLAPRKCAQSCQFLNESK